MPLLSVTLFPGLATPAVGSELASASEDLMVQFALSLPQNGDHAKGHVVVISVPKCLLLAAEQNDKAIEVTVNTVSPPRTPPTVDSEEYSPEASLKLSAFEEKRSSSSALLVPVPIDGLGALQRVTVVLPDQVKPAASGNIIEVSVAAKLNATDVPVADSKHDADPHALVVVPAPPVLAPPHLHKKELRLVVPLPPQIEQTSQGTQEATVKVAIPTTALNQASSAMSFVERVQRFGVGRKVPNSPMTGSSNAHEDSVRFDDDEWDLVVSQSRTRLVDVHALFAQEARIKLNLPDIVLLEQDSTHQPEDVSEELKHSPDFSAVSRNEAAPVMILRPGRKPWNATGDRDPTTGKWLVDLSMIKQTVVKPRSSQGAMNSQGAKVNREVTLSFDTKPDPESWQEPKRLERTSSSEWDFLLSE